MPKVTVDKDACGSCGLCVGSCPEVFDFDADGKADVIGELEGDLPFECPFGAIEVK